jgi:hypothetical protein
MLATRRAPGQATTRHRRCDPGCGHPAARTRTHSATHRHASRRHTTAPRAGSPQTRVHAGDRPASPARPKDVATRQPRPARAQPRTDTPIAAATHGAPARVRRERPPRWRPPAATSVIEDVPLRQPARARSRADAPFAAAHTTVPPRGFATTRVPRWRPPGIAGATQGVALRQPFASPSPALRQPFASPSPALRQPFASPSPALRQPAPARASPRSVTRRTLTVSPLSCSGPATGVPVWAAARQGFPGGECGATLVGRRGWFAGTRCLARVGSLVCGAFSGSSLLGFFS